MDKNKTEDLESKIIEAARALFTEKGFAETNMSDIAAKVGINRPVLHYYFRTKDRMFRTVFGSIVKEFVPQVQDIVLQRDMPAAEKISKVIDIYFTVFTANPCLPIFMMREMQRDFNFVAGFVKEMRLDSYLETIRKALQNEMSCGRLKPAEMRFLFLTFYSMITAPFSAKPLCQHAMLNEGESFNDFLAQWKPYIVDSLCRLLIPEQPGPSEHKPDTKQ